MKDKYLNNEIWVLTFGGAFQRVSIYPEKFPKEARNEFKIALREFIEQLINNQYYNVVSENNHIANIKSIREFTKGNKVGDISIPLNFGISQKLLNLYLKYQWCLGKLKIPPPHFPVDRVIQIELNKKAKALKLTSLEVKAWTLFKDEEDYMKVIRFAEKVKTSDIALKNFSLAELELHLYRRK